jgi:L,D-transpeptidase catalytic domain
MNSKKIKKQKKGKNYALNLTILIFSALVVFIGATVFFTVKSQPRCANSISCISDLSGKKSEENTGIFMGKKVTAPRLLDNPELALNNTKTVLGATTDTKHIYVSLNSQRLYAYQGNTLVYNFPISSGKWHPTPTGDFHIWVWLRYTRMTGGDASKGTYYDLPNVPFTMFFSNDSVPKNDGYSLHGAYWHNNFGHPMSHGCVNLSVDDAQKLFYWTNPLVQYTTYASANTQGTLITIYGAPPASETSFID